MATESTPTEALSKRGDVILHVGKASQKERKLLVSSVLLSHASPVFVAMFDGRFVEGQSLTSDSPRLVPLPEDDADAMATVCNIIHIQVTDIRVTTTPASLVNIAMVAHKYDCVEVIKPWSMLWVGDILKRPDAVGFESTLLATYLLNLAPEFLAVSKSLIRDRSEPLSTLAMSTGSTLLPPFLLERIVKAQSLAQKQALAALGPLALSLDCIVLNQDTAFYFRELRRTGLWPISQLSVAQIKSGLQDISSNPVVVRCENSQHCGCKYTRPNIKSILAGVHRIYESTRGLCLDCIKNLEPGIDRAGCRVKCDRTLALF